MKEAPNLEVRHNLSGRRFELEIGGKLAVADYALSGETMILTHTWVPPELRGRGLAERVVKAALEHARREGLRVIPQCSYVQSFLRRHPEDSDLRA